MERRIYENRLDNATTQDEADAILKEAEKDNELNINDYEMVVDYHAVTIIDEDELPIGEDEDYGFDFNPNQ